MMQIRCGGGIDREDSCMIALGRKDVRLKETEQKRNAYIMLCYKNRITSLAIVFFFKQKTAYEM